MEEKTMAKYYVQCGSTELVITRDSSECAALAMVDRLLSPHLWIYDDPGLSDTECLQHLMIEALMHLPTEIIVSERGFGRADGQRFGLPEMIQSWHALVVSVKRLLINGGLRIRAKSVVTGASDTDAPATQYRRIAR